MPETKTMQPPACETCGKPTRLVGLERDADDPEIAVLTFYCDSGEHYTVEAQAGIHIEPVIPE